MYPTFLDVIDVIETSALKEEAKDVEKEKMLETRKNALGKTLSIFHLGIQSDSSSSSFPAVFPGILCFAK